MHLPLRRLLQHPRLFFLGQPSPNSPRLLRSEVEREVFLVLIEETELCALVGVDDGEDFGNRLAEIVAVGYVMSVNAPRALGGRLRKLDMPRGRCRWDKHLCELGCGTAGDLLYAQLAQLGLQLAELLLQFLPVLGPQCTGLDFYGRLLRCRLASYRISIREH
jgi:hypothetical protein